MGTEEGLLDTSIRRRLWILRVDNELLPIHAPNVEIPLPEDLLTEDEREELDYTCTGTRIDSRFKLYMI
jgi:hypothetical protein